ncbi:MAG: hypothetical protein HY092_00910, partial [Candidatus Kerfeldbacteria bacterium]|nr:hypothetical protein [Candidatus Kerfeldbacteria bacterium]
MILAQLKHTVRFLLVGSAALGGLTFVLLGPRATQGQATAPQITFINVRSVGGDTATIDFSTNVPTEARIHYGLTSSYTTYEPASTWDGEKITHEIILSSLTQNTTYHFQIEVRLKGTTVCNFGTDCAKSADRTLRTSSGTGAGSLAITGITADCIDTSCYLIYSTGGDAATVGARWGISSASNFSGNPPDPAGYPAASFVTETSPQTGKRSIQIGPLVANTTYYYRLQANGAAGQFTTDELTLKTSTNAVDHVFSTGACRDGTAIGACNNNHEYCSTSGSLIQDCTRCGFLCPAGQTCTGSVGSGACIVDPALNGAPSQCNQPDCYTPSGQFINPAPAGCYASWSACSANTILKVRKDRGCNLWLSCDSTFQSAPNPASGTVAENQCLSLVGCNQINDKGQCVNPLPTGQCSNDPIRFCNVDSDCTA